MAHVRHYIYIYSVPIGTLYYDTDGYADRPSEVKSTRVFVQEGGGLRVGTYCYYIRVERETFLIISTIMRYII